MLCEEEKRLRLETAVVYICEKENRDGINRELVLFAYENRSVDGAIKDKRARETRLNIN